MKQKNFSLIYRTYIHYQITTEFFIFYFSADYEGLLYSHSYFSRYSGFSIFHENETVIYLDICNSN